MKRLIRWGGILILVAGAAYVMLAIPFEGKTLVGHFLDLPIFKKETKALGSNASRSPRKPIGPEENPITEEDRHKLDELIRNKIESKKAPQPKVQPKVPGK